MGSRIIKRVLGRDFTPPSAPTGLTALALDPYRIKLDCNNALDGFADPGEAVTGIAAYQWQWSTDGVGWGSLADTAVSTYTHEGLQPSTLAFYRVRAMDLAGNVSGFSSVASATTLPVETGNRPPVWNTSSIPVYAYAGQAVSQSIAGFASDPDGDTLTFSEEPTPVLASLGLSLNANGLLSGTIPSGANLQTATTNISVSDGEYTVVLNAGLTITVLDGADAQADWDARSRADGVFWGCNLAEWVRGIDGYTSQPTKDFPSGQPGQRRTPIADISQVPANEAILLSDKNYLGDLGDGFGTMKLDVVPGVSGKMLTVRKGTVEQYDFSDLGVGDWNVLPWAWAPVNFRDAEQGTGEPNVRRGLKGTVGEGSLLAFVETRASDPPLTSKQNPLRLPMVRHFFLQFILRVPAYHWGYMHRLFYQPPYVAGVSIADRDNKIVFVNGGYNPGQWAIKLDHTFLLSSMGYRGTSTGGVSGALEQNVRGNTVSGTPRDKITLAHTALTPPGGYPALTAANTAEEWMMSRGPSATAMAWGLGIFPNGTSQPGAKREFDWYDPEDVRLNGMSYADANKLSNPARAYPYGGFPTNGQYPYHELPWPSGFQSGVLRPDVPHVVQVMLSEQVDAPVDQDAGISWNDDTRKGPRITAIWASALGDPPRLLVYTGSNGRNGPSMIPSRAMHRASGANGVTIPADTATQFKMQENAVEDNRSNCGFMVVGALDGFADPVHDGDTTVFYALRANPEGDLPTQYVDTAIRKFVDPGTVHNFGGDLGMGFAKGELSGAAYLPAQPKRNWQFKIRRTEYAGRSITVPNAYRTDLALVTAAVHKITLDTATPVLPRARAADYIGDCFNVLFARDHGKPLGRQIQYGEVLFGLKWIPWPRHLGVQPEWPWT
jgi:hypothetical protein